MSRLRSVGGQRVQQSARHGERHDRDTRLRGWGGRLVQPNLRMGVRSGAGQVSWQSGGRLRPEREAGHSSVWLKVLPAVWALRGACCVVRMRG